MVSIITVNYNGYKDTLELVESIRQFEDYPHEVHRGGQCLAQR